MEWLEQVPDLDAVIIAIGGGGLCGGASAAIKLLKPDCLVFGVEPTGSDHPLLEVRGISAGYGDLIAIRDVSFQVAKGELVAVIGRNGAGKSTTLLTVQGMLKARTGAVVLDGHDVTTKSVNARITAGLSDAERTELLALLTKLAETRGLAPGIHPGYRRL